MYVWTTCPRLLLDSAAARTRTSDHWVTSRCISPQPYRLLSHTHCISFSGKATVYWGSFEPPVTFRLTPGNFWLSPTRSVINYSTKLSCWQTLSKCTKNLQIWTSNFKAPDPTLFPDLTRITPTTKYPASPLFSLCLAAPLPPWETKGRRITFVFGIDNSHQRKVGVTW